MLPRNLTNHVRVTMVGSMTPTQAAACKKRYQLNLTLCREMLHWLERNNRVYKQHKKEVASVSESRAHNIPTSVIIDGTTPSDSMDSLVDAIRDESTYSTFGSSVGEGHDPSIEGTWVDSSSFLARPSQGEYVDLIVRKSNAYEAMSKWAVSVKMFPSLFPGGCGGPTEPRVKYISVRKWILRCLRIYGHRFETHHAFMLLAFDYLAAENARRTLYIKMDIKRQAVNAGQVSKSVVLEAIQYFKYLTECRGKGVKPHPPSHDVQRVIDIRKGLRIPESAFYGSNAGRMRARHDLFGLLKRFGPLQIFFTVSPDSAGTYNIAIKAGRVSRKNVEEANMLVLPSRAERKSIAASYPVECARYFLRVMDTVVGVLLGWDRKAQAPKRNGGIFGVVRAFGAAVETQRAGDLHAHFAVWLRGFPSTGKELEDALKSDSRFRDRMTSLADKVLTAKPPCIHEEGKCTNCCADGSTLESVIPGVDAFRRPIAGSSAPTTASCRACRATFADKDIMNSTLELLVEMQHLRRNSEWTDYIKCRPPQLDSEDELATSLIVRDVQTHYWNHCHSCFKKTIRTPKGSVCRFFKPEEVHTGPTYIDDDQRLRLPRPIGCEYVNAYNPVTMSVLKCNHDAQFVLSSGAKDAAAYVVKYCFKNQNPVENQAALSLAAFAKAATKVNSTAPDATDMEKGYRILGSMLYTITNGQEVAAPMAALYLLNETPFWFSHSFAHVNLRTMLQKRVGSFELSVSQEILADRSIISTDTLLEKYWKRQSSLENVPFIDICEQYEGNAAAKRMDRNSEFVPVFFSKAPTQKVLVLCGDEIPDIGSNVDASSIDYYYKAVLTLFKPHRQTTLLNPDQSALATYRSFIHLENSNVQRLLKFEEQWKDYYRAQRKDHDDIESPEAILLRTRPPSMNSSLPIDNLERFPRHDVDAEFEIPDDFSFIPIGTQSDLSTQKLSDDAKQIVISVPRLEKAISQAGRAYRREHPLVLPANFTCADCVSRVIRPGTGAMDSEDCLGTHNFVSEFKNARTRLERLAECFAPVPHPSQTGVPSYTPGTLPQFPKIAEVSKAFELNFWQHVIFEVAARHLLYAYSQDIENALSESLFPSNVHPPTYGIKPQLVGYLGGEAGTGKSTVIHALLTFAKRWGRAGTVETLAFTGAAAINVNGRTMHSARNLKLGGTEPNAPPTLEMKSKYHRVVLIIIDEISITDQGLLGGTDSVSRAMSPTPDKFMGGKHTLLIGDFLQLPPIAGTPCFQPPPPGANRQRHAGYALYSAVNFVVFLTINMRARFDPEYTQILDDLRWGRLSDSQLATLNTRVQSKNEDDISTEDQHQQFYRPVAVCTNKLRCAINFTMTCQISRELGLTVYESMASPSARSKTIVDHLVNCDDNLTDRIPIKLLFLLGCLSWSHENTLNCWMQT